jgi:hypothetical protein
MKFKLVKVIDDNNIDIIRECDIDEEDITFTSSMTMENIKNLPKIKISDDISCISSDSDDELLRLVNALYCLCESSMSISQLILLRLWQRHPENKDIYHKDYLKETESYLKAKRNIKVLMNMVNCKITEYRDNANIHIMID